MIEEKKRKVSLKKQESSLVKAENQLKELNGQLFFKPEFPKFSDKVTSCNHKLKSKKLEILQVNIGYMCNQVCEHCHVDAGPDRTELMSRETMQQCLSVIEKTSVHTVDITGGAPEMNPNFKWFIEALSKLGIEDIIVRSNLTIIVSHPNYHDLPEFFKKHKVHVVSSLPCYTEQNVDKQRGKGVFHQSIEALKRLNAVGYGKDLQLDLVFNPGGSSLSGDQALLERDYKQQLLDNFGIVFNRLFTITNLPISRFLDFLIASERFEEYMQKLIQAFNPETLNHVMCTNTISVDWKGYIYDCDFNQILGLKNTSRIQHVLDFDEAKMQGREIAVSQHCYGCTAGAGSSCQGAVIN